MSYWTQTEIVTRWQMWLVAAQFALSFWLFGWISRGWHEEDKKHGNPILWWIRHHFKR